MKKNAFKQVEELLGEEISDFSTVSGGCINQAFFIKLKSKRSFFLKTNSAPPPKMFAFEVRGLEEIAKHFLKKAHAIKTPHVYGVGEHFLLMEYLPPSPKDKKFYSKLGRELAKMHRVSEKKFGQDEDNYIGTNVQRNGWHSSWSDFFWNERLMYQTQLLPKHYRLSIEEKLKPLGPFIKTLLDDASPVAPSLLHGDLWGGNTHCASGGEVYLIDPAFYYGDRETDVAMAHLFGGFPPEFYKAYHEEYPLSTGHEIREVVYNLYHLLNHLNLFGGIYFSQIQESLKRLRMI